VSTPAPAREHALIAPYEAILAHAELELELAGRGEVQALDALGARWDQLIAGVEGLAAPPSAQAGAVLARARLVHERTGIELLRLRESLVQGLDTTTRARRTAERYGGELPSSGRLDRSA
jgi:hypothetical protein